MKTKKFLVSIVLIVLCVGMVLGLTACSSPFTEENDQAFFNNLCMVVDTKDNIQVESVTEYYFNNIYYYYVNYSFYNEFKNKWVDLKKVKIFKSTLFSTEFNLDNILEEEKNYYDKYLEAKEKGKKKVFTEEEIEKYVDTAFQNLDKE